MADPRTTPRERLARAWRLTRAISHLGLSVVLWTTGTVLVALGAVLALVIVAVDAEPARFFAQLHNLSSHYLDAQAAARARFDRQLSCLFLALVSLLLIARGPSFAARLRRELSEGGPHA